MTDRPADAADLPITLSDSRRLPGLNLLWDRPGAVADIACREVLIEPFLREWRGAARAMLDAVGWRDQQLTTRRFPHGASVALSAPIDALFSATEVNEWAVAVATAILTHRPEPPLADNAALLRARIEAESNPALLALHAAALAHQVTFLFDPDEASVGGGTGSRHWPITALPRPELVDWAVVHDVPVVLVTGSNGKTTTVRLLAAIATEAGFRTGLSCTDNVTIGGEVRDRGDWAGPAGARYVLREPTVEFAVLETARGGILRRGLAVRRAVTAIVTNIAEDHFGEWGITDLRSLAETKLVVGRAVAPGGHLVLNADDPVLVAARTSVTVPILWTSLHADLPLLREHLAAGGAGCWVEQGAVMLALGESRGTVLPLAEIPLTLDGAARHNVYNVLGAVGLAASARLPLDAIRRGLARFVGTARDNPGRQNLYRLGGVTVVVDFAHNPHGMDAMVDLAAALPATRRLVVLGQAGDRDDDALRQLADSAWRLRPDRIVLKEMEHYRRGRPPGEISDVMAQEFLRLGAPGTSIVRMDSELEAVREALRWARRGDLLLLPTHAERSRVLGLLDLLEQRQWQPGDALPEKE